jgi:hypothetical protein
MFKRLFHDIQHVCNDVRLTCGLILNSNVIYIHLISVVISVRSCSALFHHLISLCCCFFVKLLLPQYSSYFFIILQYCIFSEYLFNNTHIQFHSYIFSGVPLDTKLYFTVLSHREDSEILIYLFLFMFRCAKHSASTYQASWYSSHIMLRSI